MKIYDFLKKNISSENFLIALSPLLGFLSFYIVINSSNTESIKLLSLYVASQAASSFLLLAIQYSQNRKSVLSKNFLIFLVFFFSLIFIFYKGTSGTNLLNEFLIVNVFLITLLTQLVLTALKRFKILLIVQGVYALCLPFIIFFPLVIILLSIFIFIFVSLKFNLFNLLKESKFNINEFYDWSNSFFIQTPFTLFPFFDPFLVSRIDTEIYALYLLYSKFFFGIMNFSFSFFQFKLIKGISLEIDGLLYLIFISIFLSVLFIFIQLPLYLIVLIFAFVVNASSLYARSKIEEVNFIHTFISVISIFIYLLGLIFFPDAFFSSNNYYFLTFLIFCVSFPIFVIWFSKKT